MCGKVEFWNHPYNDLVIQLFGIIEGGSLQMLAKVFGPLVHNIIRCDLLWFEIVACALNNNIVNVGIPDRV